MHGLPTIDIEVPAADHTRSGVQGRLLTWVWRIAVGVLTLAVLALAWLVAFGNLFTSGSNLGYNLGLAGGLMMLSLLLYPLRKRLRIFQQLGRMEGWFRYHMFMGIAGPVLVLFHSTFRIGAMNSRIALYSMLLVALSGIIGRFVYRRVHRGLYGSALTMSGVQTQLRASEQQIGSVFQLSPAIESTLKQFREYATTSQPGLPQKVWRFMTLRFRSRSVLRHVRQMVKKALAVQARRENWSKGQLRLNYVVAIEEIDNYVESVIEFTQLSHWLKLFSLWHVAHVPFIYLLVFSGIAHVIAVHLY